MPQIVAAVIIGAGIAAGIKWLAREVARAAKSARVASEDLKRRKPARVKPTDLGALEYDAKAGVYRPARKRS